MERQRKKRQQGVYGKEERLFDGIIYIILFLVLALMVYPLIYVVSCSLSDPLLVLGERSGFCLRASIWIPTLRC